MEEDYDRARRCYEIILASNPDDQLAADNLKLTLEVQKRNGADKVSKLMDENKVDEAFVLVNQLIEQDPNSATLYNLLARIYGEKKGNIDAAIPYLNKAIELDPDFVSAYENLGIAYATKGNFPKALELLNKALELDPENEHVKKNIDMLYSNMGGSQK